MGRKNHRRQAPQAQSRRRGLPPPPPLEALVIPQGRCYSGTKAKLQFTREQAPKALEQARAAKMRKGLTIHIEKRYYQCPTCGFYHLTSRESYEERGQG